MRSANLEYFKLVVESGSLTRAARIYGVNVSTLARAIDKLEDQLGVTLLERNHSGVRLTTAGDFLFHRIASLLDDLDEIKTFAQMYGTGHQGIIRIGSLLPPTGKYFRLALSTWQKRHPSVRIIFHEMKTGDLREALFRGRVDVVFFTPCIQADSIESLLFYNENLVLALPCDHPLHRCNSIIREQIRNETFLLQDWERDHNVRTRYNELFGQNIAIEIHPAGKQSVLALVSAGFGVTLALQSQAELGFPGVIFRPLRDDDARLQIHIGWDANRKDAVIGCFVAFVRDLIRRN
ncbi:LysR family transcriptional regulator [Acetobacter lovaniensis]|jgi:DNA-binding transcriptional LysR family regulator|uniref:LysR family transcriptional regulator n=1 Tax=Acetobacter lovaniensis TaxID=104100 RepID=UPI00209F9139|nr:LysR family transcriptional regulator [Acetobacter lovaniensis]MCP1240251.1 LysR family transcriptional regulator [Acetobacter lovaniensis]